MLVLNTPKLIQTSSVDYIDTGGYHSEVETDINPAVESSKSSPTELFESPKHQAELFASPKHSKTHSDEFLWDVIDNGSCVTFGESDSEQDIPGSLTNDLAQWQSDNAIPKKSLTKLLKILRRHNIDVPSDADTVLRTPQSGTLEILSKSGLFIFILIAIDLLKRPFL